MKKILWGLIAILVIGFLVQHICYKTRIGYWQKRCEISENIIETAIKIEKDKYEEKIQAKDLLIADLQAENKVSQERVSDYEGKMDDLGEQIQGLEKDRESITGCEETVVNLEKQVNTWKERFAQAEKTIAEQKTQILNLTKQYKLQLSISQDFCTMYRAELYKRLALEVRLDIIEKKQKQNKAIDLIQYTAITVLTGVVILK